MMRVVRCAIRFSKALPGSSDSERLSKEDVASSRTRILWVFQNRPRDGDALPLASGQLDALFSHRACRSHSPIPMMKSCALAERAAAMSFLFRSVQFSVQDIFPHRPAEQQGFLRHQSDLIEIAFQIEFDECRNRRKEPCPASGSKNRCRSWITVDFPSSTGPHQRHGFSGFDVETHVLEDGCVFLVAEGELPSNSIRPLRSGTGTGFSRILNERLRVEDFIDPLHRSPAFPGFGRTNARTCRWARR